MREAPACLFARVRACVCARRQLGERAARAGGQVGVQVGLRAGWLAGWQAGRQAGEQGRRLVGTWAGRWSGRRAGGHVCGCACVRVKLRHWQRHSIEQVQGSLYKIEFANPNGQQAYSNI